jgi:hypothetical protein
MGITNSYSYKCENTQENMQNENDTDETQNKTKKSILINLIRHFI